MRRLALCLVLLAAAPAHAAGPQVTDPAGDATFAGVSAPAASRAEYDVTALRWWADDAAQHVSVTFAGTPADGRYVLTWASATCARVTLSWWPASTYSYLEGCQPRHRRWPKPPVRSGRTLTFSIPRAELPTWVAEGSTIHALGVSAEVYVDATSAATWLAADEAYSDVRYVVGS